MASAAVRSLEQTIGTYQLDYGDSYPISLPLNQEILSMANCAYSLRRSLEDSPNKTIGFEKQITEIANRAEDTIEFHMSEKLRSDRGSTKSKIKFKRHLRKVAEEIVSIVQEIYDAPLSESSSSSLPQPTAANDMLVGFDDELGEIKDWLCGESSQRLILPIVGAGGIGKTTLVRNIYDYSQTMNHFEIHAWVTVSQHYNVEQILLGLLLSLGVPRENIPEQNNELMGEKLLETLYGRRYFIVLDDVWSAEVWDRMCRFLPNHINSSRIMITTRQVGLAVKLWGFFYEIYLMDNDQSWGLLQLRVFGYDACPDELQDIGKEIARSCRGLPLTIVVVAEVLSTIDPTRASWEAIADGIISAVSTKEGRIGMMVASSYNHLPAYLRPCLLYMVGFPRDHVICVPKLIKLWIVEGFVEHHRSKTSEEVAEEYLEDLVYRSLVSINRRKNIKGKIKSCFLHDVVWNFCIRKAQEEKFLLPVMDYLPNTTLRRHFLPKVLKNQRRIAVASYDLDLKETIYDSPIRTIICIQQRGYWPMGSVRDYRFLRVLHAVNENYDLNWEPYQLCELIHLRYLAVKIPLIPAAISKLQNLQTLIIYKHDVRLPEEIWRLTQLTHLIAFSFHPLPHPQQATCPLENLLMLSLATNFVCSKRILELIPNLTKLGICYSKDKFDEDYQLDNLQHLHGVRELKLLMHRDFPLWQNLNFSFPKWLQKLSLSGCRLPWEDMKLVGSLALLRVLKLRDLAFQGAKWHTTVGEFPNLKFLLIDDSDLQRWITKWAHFPSLEILLLYRCPDLREIPFRIGHIPTLELIEVDDRNGSVVVSAFRIQEERKKLWKNDVLDVRVKYL